MSEVLHRVFGGTGLKAFWYHFAIMFEALFILTTVDAGTRVARFMLSDGLSNLGGPLRKLRDPSWRVGVWTCSLAVVALWGSILLMGITDPLGGINSLFPLFGIANQLLAAIALTIVTVVVVKKGYLKWMWIPGIPLLWDLIVTLTASWQKIFSGDPRVGFWTQHFQYRDALDAGKTSFGSAKNVDAMEAVIRNTFIQGTLSIVFALMVVIVFGAGLIMVMRVLRGGGTPLTEDEPVRVETLRAIGPDPHQGRNGRCKSNGTRCRNRTPDRLVLGHIDGRQPLPALRRTSRAHAPRRAGACPSASTGGCGTTRPRPTPTRAAARRESARRDDAVGNPRRHRRIRTSTGTRRARRRYAPRRRQPAHTDRVGAVHTEFDELVLGEMRRRSSYTASSIERWSVANRSAKRSALRSAGDRSSASAGCSSEHTRSSVRPSSMALW